MPPPNRRLVINLEKCEFAIPEVDFLGHPVTASGFSPLPAQVTAIQNYPRPSVVKELLAFLGVFNFYRRFVSVAAKILRPLTDATRGSPKGGGGVVPAHGQWLLRPPGLRWAQPRCWHTRSKTRS